MDAATFLGLRRLDERRFALEVTEALATPGRFLFGGCGLAAGVAALEAVTGRPAVWATAQYLAYAPRDSEVVVTTDVLVAGGHVTQARASAWVQDREILGVCAALGTGQLTAPAWAAPPAVAAPANCPARVFPPLYDRSIFSHVETRLARGRPLAELDGTPGEPDTALWARIPGHLEPSAATLAILGDFVSGGASEPMGRRTRGRSLDNTIRVARLVPSEWVLCDIRMHALVGGFGQGTAFLWSEGGVLLGTASQTIAARLGEIPSPPGAAG